MSIHDITSALWRRRRLFGITFAAAFLVVIVITVVVPKVYQATTTIYVETGRTASADQGEQLSRTYTALASNPNTADAALEALDLDLTRDELLDKMSFAPLERTQLLGISAEDGSPEKAQLIANGYADAFAERVEEQFAAGEAPSIVRVSQPATKPTKPIRPNPPLYLAFGGLLSLMLAAAAALMRDRIDPSLQVGPHDEMVAGEPIIGRIPTLLKQPQHGGESHPQILDAARILSADAFRVLRTNLALAPGEPARTIAITSTGSGEGKTTIASQLALTLATDRERVTVVECDLRRQALHGIGSEERSSRGLAGYLSGDLAKEAIVRTTPSLPQLSIVWAGGKVAEPGPLLRSPRLPELLQWLRARNDWIILDTPPIGVGDDALVVSSHADGTLVVVTAEETSVPNLDAGLGQLRRVGARILGLVLNRAPTNVSGVYNYLLEPTAEDLDQLDRPGAPPTGTPVQTAPAGGGPADRKSSAVQPERAKAPGASGTGSVAERPGKVEVPDPGGSREG